MKSIKLPCLAMAALLSLMMASCEKEEAKLTFTAIVNEVYQLDEITSGEDPGLGRIVVTTEEIDVISSDKASVGIVQTTKILLPDGSEGTLSDIKRDSKVEITFDGLIRESYPVQITAIQIKIQ